MHKMEQRSCIILIKHTLKNRLVYKILVTILKSGTPWQSETLLWFYLTHSFQHLFKWVICVRWLRSRTLKPYDLRLEWTFNLLKAWACMGFPGGSAGKESAWNAGDPGGRIGYSHQYSWASLVAQMVKNPPAMWETWVRSMGCEDPLEEGIATHSSILAWRIPMDRGAWQATAHRVGKSWTWLSN